MDNIAKIRSALGGEGLPGSGSREGEGGEAVAILRQKNQELEVKSRNHSDQIMILEERVRALKDWNAQALLKEKAAMEQVSKANFEHFQRLRQFEQKYEQQRTLNEDLIFKLEKANNDIEIANERARMQAIETQKLKKLVISWSQRNRSLKESSDQPPVNPAPN